MLLAAPPVGFADVENRLKLLYWAKSKQDLNDSVSDLGSLRASLSELASMRKSHRRYRSLRLQSKRDDLWHSISPAFAEIRDYIAEHRIRRAGMSLELSDSLHSRDFIEYEVSLPSGTLQAVTCAFASEGMQDGLITLEVFSSDQTVIAESVLDLSKLSMHLPIRFAIRSGVKTRAEDKLVLRFTAQSHWPLYILEFATYGALGLQRRVVGPFASFDVGEVA
jgi:hypothetical protein